MSCKGKSVVVVKNEEYETEREKCIGSSAQGSTCGGGGSMYRNKGTTKLIYAVHEEQEKQYIHVHHMYMYMCMYPLPCGKQ